MTAVSDACCSQEAVPDGGLEYFTGDFFRGGDWCERDAILSRLDERPAFIGRDLAEKLISEKHGLQREVRENINTCHGQGVPK